MTNFLPNDYNAVYASFSQPMRLVVSYFQEIEKIMAIPDFQSFLLPVLRLASTCDVRTKDSLDASAGELGSTEEDRDMDEDFFEGLGE